MVFILVLKQKLDPGDLVKMVATPGGTTAAGMSVLGTNSVGNALGNTIRKASARSREMGKNK